MVLQQEAESPLQDSSTDAVTSETNSGPVFSLSDDGGATDFVFFKNDCIYHHKLYIIGGEVKSNEFVVVYAVILKENKNNANGSTSSSNSHPFLYARVLGAYHANVLYTGPGMQNHEARRFDFLWVRWYELVDPASSGWSSRSKLVAVCFPPMHQANSFGSERHLTWVSCNSSLCKRQTTYKRGWSITLR
jgi:hypothetical protein